MQITPKSRSEVAQYGEIEAEVTGLIGKVNGRFGDAAWTPIRYVNRSYSRTVLAGLYRAADVAMVTPLRDGMNLVAKEYLAAQDPDDPGVLVLSRFAGAAKELDGALIVNPHETDAVAAALKRALECHSRSAASDMSRCSSACSNMTSELAGGISRTADRGPAAEAPDRQYPGAVRRVSLNVRLRSGEPPRAALSTFDSTHCWSE